MRTEERFFLDTNIVMYAIGKEHHYKHPCITTLKQIEAGALRVVTSVEVLQEILHRYFSLGRPRIAATAFSALKELCVEILPVLEADLDLALDLMHGFPQIKIRDAIHAATMQNNGLSKIISTDKHFDAIEGISRIDPTSLKGVKNL